MNTKIPPVLIRISIVLAGIVIWPGNAISQFKETAQTPAKTLSNPQLNSNMLQKCQQAVQSIPSCNYTTGAQTGAGPDVCTGQPLDNFGVNPVGTQYCVTALFKQYPKCLQELQKGDPDCLVDALLPTSDRRSTQTFFKNASRLFKLSIHATIRLVYRQVRGKVFAHNNPSIILALALLVSSIVLRRYSNNIQNAWKNFRKAILTAL